MNLKSVFALPLLAAAAGCGSVAEVRHNIETQVPAAKRDFDVPQPKAKTSRVVQVEGSLIPVKKVHLSQAGSNWLKTKRFDYYVAATPTRISQIIASISEKGINITSELPLDSYTFMGTISPTDVETALRMILGSAKLDYSVDEVRHVVTIKPLPTKTWTFDIDNRRSSFSAGQVASSNSGGLQGNNNQNQNGSGNTGSGTQGQNSNATTQGGTGGSNTYGQNGQSGSTGVGASSSSSTSGGAGSGQYGIENNEDFWADLDVELTRRLKVMLPKASARVNAAAAPGTFPTEIPGMQFAGAPTVQSPQLPQMQADVSADGQSGSEMFTLTKIGTHSINRSTGAVWVQAPRWVLDDLDTYMRQVYEMYKAQITYEALLVLVNHTNGHREDIDLQAFGKWAQGRYGAILSNNALGGVSVNFGQGNIPTVSAAGQVIAAPLLGIQSAKDGLSAFSDYAQGLSNYIVKGRVKVTTNTGLPASTSVTEPIPYQLVQQSATVGNVGAAQQSTNYIIQTANFGTTLRVKPRYDLATGMVRSLVTVQSLIYAGDKSFQQTFGIGATAQTIVNSIPLGKDMEILGSTRMRSGDLIVLGGQDTETMQTNESGVPGPNGVPVGGVLGTKQSNVTRGTYYVLLHMIVRKD